MKTKILSILMALGMLFSLAPVTLADASTSVVTIEGIGYTSLQEAIDNIAYGTTKNVLLEEDITLDSPITLNGDRGIHLDLQGHKITTTCENAFILDDCVLMLSDSRTGGGVHGTKRTMFLIKEGVLGLDDADFTSEATWQGSAAGETFGGELVRVLGSTSQDRMYQSILIIKNTASLEYVGDPVTNALGVVVAATSGCAYGVKAELRGTIDVGEGGSAFTIERTFSTTTVNVPEILIGVGATITGSINAAGYGKWKVYNATITGNEVFSINSGSFDIYAGSFTATGQYSDPASVNNRGSEETGAVVSILSDAKYIGNIAVEISGGTFISQNGNAIYEGIAKIGPFPVAAASKVTSLHLGGAAKFAGGSDKAAICVEEYASPFIESGFFTSPPKISDVISPGLITSSDDEDYPFCVQPKPEGSSVATLLDCITREKNSGGAIIPAELSAALTEMTLSPELVMEFWALAEQGFYPTPELMDALWPINENQILYIIQPYLEFEALEFDDTDGTLTLEISLPYKVYATGSPSIPDDLEGPLCALHISRTHEVTEPARVTLPLTEAYFSLFPDPDNIEIQHSKDGELYYYETEYDGDATPNTLSFITTNGFSSFTLLAGEAPEPPPGEDDPSDPPPTFIYPTTPARPWFTDVSEDDRFYDAVKYVYDEGLMDGIGGGLFGPELPTTRAMAIVLLHRLEGSPEATETAPFTDTTADWYKAAIDWGYENKLIKGCGDGLFCPDSSVTREDLLVILHRYAAYKGYDTAATADLSAFSDADEISGYALDAVKWAIARALIQGREQGALAPRGTATRAEQAMIMLRFSK